MIVVNKDVLERNKMNNLYVWFPDSHLETISIRCLFFTRLLKYSQVDFDIDYILLPNQLKKLQFEASEIPLLQQGNEVLKQDQMIQLCLNSADQKGVPLISHDRSFGSKILFHWATTHLLGVYVGFLYGDKDIRKRVYADYLKTHSEFTEEHLDEISHSMLAWSLHNRDISIAKSQQKEEVFEILDGFNDHLKNSKYWFGNEPSVSDFALFAFAYMMYNTQMIYFHDFIKEREYLLKWMRDLDSLSHNKYSRLKL